MIYLYKESGWVHSVNTMQTEERLREKSNHAGCWVSEPFMTKIDKMKYWALHVCNKNTYS